MATFGNSALFPRRASPIRLNQLTFKPGLWSSRRMLQGNSANYTWDTSDGIPYLTELRCAAYSVRLT